MDFYFPDSQDQIDPDYDFVTEEHLPFHVRQRDDRYAHEIHDPPPYSGILVSKTMVDGGGSGTRYTTSHRHRLYRLGVHRFFRLPTGLKVIGDCGAFSYVNEEKPPVSVSEVIDFYENLGVDEGVSVDHVILGFQADGEPREDWIDRQAITLELAADFFDEHKRRGCRFGAMGAAQGWSPASYAASVERLQEIGYQRIALGGMVSLKIEQIIDSLEAIGRIRLPETRLHLLGISRAEHYQTFRGLGVTSLDSTSPFRQAFKDDKDNYYTPPTVNDDAANYVALRIPSAEGNTRLRGRIRAGQLDQQTVSRAEQWALKSVRAYDLGKGTLTVARDALIEYEQIFGTNRRDHTEAYHATLEARPWAKCPCGVCTRWGVEVAIFRCTQRNKRRGFHNLWVFNQTMQRNLARGERVEAPLREAADA